MSESIERLDEDEFEWSLERFMRECDEVHANPRTYDGLELIECAAEPRHWPTYVAHVDGMYPAPCYHCIIDESAKDSAARVCRTEHHAWQTWRITKRFARWAYPMGVIAGSSTAYNGCKAHPVRVSLYWRGRRPYILGRKRAR